MTSPTAPPAVTAVVVVHGSPEPTVRASVQSLLDSTGVDVHVVLVDNASPDGGAACAPWATHERMTLVRSVRNDGFAAGVNQGLRHQREGDLLWLLNDDATVEPDCIAACASVLAAHADAVVVAPRVMLANEPDRIDSIGVVLPPNGEAFNAFIGQRWTGQVADGERIFGPCFSAALFRPDAFRPTSVGPIDERYRLYYEDIDWDLRAAALGLRAVAATAAVVLHQHAGSTRLLGEPARYELVQRNLLLCATKNLSIRSVVRIWWGRLIVQAKGVIKGPMRAERIRSLVRAVAGTSSVLRARRSLPRPSEALEAELFAYSTSHVPNFSADTYATLDD
ncbi:MAG: glycosyltransferase family 2 protein [Ilumatobacteraceae bacterium]